MNASAVRGPLMRLFGYCVLGGLLCSVSGVRADGDAAPAFAPGDYAFVRTLRASMQTEGWREAKTLADRLAAWRSDIKVYKPGQTPISDRYIVTCYAGIIDLRHFLYTADKVLTASGSKGWKGLTEPIDPRYASRPYRNPFARSFAGPEFHIQLALFDTFCVERGREYVIAQQVEKPENLQALIEGQFWQATPEDLPSSALGAEFARKLMRVREPLMVNVEAELCAFLAPFKPVPDKVREGISHNMAVFGVEDTAVEKIPPERLVWFSAEPAAFTAMINKQAEKVGLGKICDEVKDGKEGLAKAGYEVVNVAGGMPLEIRPIKQAE